MIRAPAIFSFLFFPSLLATFLTIPTEGFTPLSPNQHQHPPASKPHQPDTKDKDKEKQHLDQRDLVSLIDKCDETTALTKPLAANPEDAHIDTSQDDQRHLDLQGIQRQYDDYQNLLGDGEESATTTKSERSTAETPYLAIPSLYTSTKNKNIEDDLVAQEEALQEALRLTALEKFKQQEVAEIALRDFRQAAGDLDQAHSLGEEAHKDLEGSKDQVELLESTIEGAKDNGDSIIDHYETTERLRDLSVSHAAQHQEEFAKLEEEIAGVRELVAMEKHREATELLKELERKEQDLKAKLRQVHDDRIATAIREWSARNLPSSADLDDPHRRQSLIAYIQHGLNTRPNPATPKESYEMIPVKAESSTSPTSYTVNNIQQAIDEWWALYSNKSRPDDDINVANPNDALGAPPRRDSFLSRFIRHGSAAPPDPNDAPRISQDE